MEIKKTITNLMKPGDLFVGARARHPVKAAPPGWIKQFNWGFIQYGDCSLVGVSVYVYPDTGIFFSAGFSSNNDGDVWLMKAMVFSGWAQGPQIGSPVPQHDSPNSIANIDIGWAFETAIPNTTPAEVPNINYLTLIYHC
jgi:hypothetical protein